LRSREFYALKQCEQRAARQQSAQREVSDWRKVSVGQLMVGNFKSWDNLSRHEQRLENAFYKALRELKLWRKEKRTAQRDQSDKSDNDTTPQTSISERSEESDSSTATSSSISQNEPTARTTSTLTAACIASLAQRTPTNIPLQWNDSSQTTNPIESPSSTP